MARSDETERYREAAHMALDQLDWCVKYLRRLRKERIAEQIAKNRSAIASSLPARNDEPVRRT